MWTLSVKSCCMALGELASGVRGEGCPFLTSSGVGSRQNCLARSATSLLCRSIVHIPAVFCQGMPRPRFLRSSGVILADCDMSERERLFESRRHLSATEAGLQLDEGLEQ